MPFHIVLYIHTWDYLVVYLCYLIHNPFEPIEGPLLFRDPTEVRICRAPRLLFPSRTLIVHNRAEV